MARALKVYCTPSGFSDALVAAPNQTAALKAWGITSNLFAEGLASVITDPELCALALAKPGEVIKRPRGDVAKLMAQPKPASGSKTTSSSPSEPVKVAVKRKAGQKPLERRPPDRSALDVAEAAVSATQARLEAQLLDLAKERKELHARESSLRRGAEAELRRLETAREQAQAAYREAGG